MLQHYIQINTQGRALYPISNNINNLIFESSITVGLCHLFIKHTSASLIVGENFDPTVLKDLEYFISQLVVDGAEWMQHQSEGKDDMSAHIRSVLTQTHLTIPIVNSKLDLGKWQGIFLWEHRLHPHCRTISVTLQE